MVAMVTETLNDSRSQIVHKKQFSFCAFCTMALTKISDYRIIQRTK